MNYDIRSCKIIAILTSVIIFFVYMNLGIIVFTSFDRFLHVKLVERFQPGFNEKAVDIFSGIIISASFLICLEEILNGFTPSRMF